MDTTPISELLTSLTEEQVDAVVTKLVISHQNGTISPQEALSGIAQIAALRAVPAALAKRIRHTK